MLARASNSVSTSRSRAIGARLMRSSSALIKPMSNEALWITSGASPMNAIKSSTTSANSGLSARKAVERSVHRKRFRRHFTLGIDMAVKGLAGRHAVENLDATDFNQPITPQRIEAGGFGIEDDFAHGCTLEGSDESDCAAAAFLPAWFRMSRICARTGSRPCEVSTTKSARLRFSASGNCRARMASSFSPRHVIARQNPFALEFRRGGDHNDRIDALLAAGLE